MKIDQVDFHYLSMPEVTSDADGSQDALVVRVAVGPHEGWGECEASPLTSIAAFVAPMSHGACRPVADSVLGARMGDPEDIAAIAARVRYDSMDLLQAAHTWSGIEMALWDALGKMRQEPVWRILGDAESHPKTPYASCLFGATPADTLDTARQVRRDGFAAAKFGWGPFGRDTVAADADQLHAAREGLGPDARLMVDAGQIFGADVAAAVARLPALQACDTTWFEEPFQAEAFEAYAALAAQSGSVAIAGGEAAHNADMAMHLIDYAKVSFIQIDCGRIGGIGPARQVADYAAHRGVDYVNHTFTSHLALSASLQPYAGRAAFDICEFPAQPRQLAVDLTRNHIARGPDGLVSAPDAPGLGVEVNEEALKTYHVDVDITVNGRRLF